MLKLYNSLTNKKEVFKPIRNDQVGMYSCGPTVYDHVHIGNLRAFLLPDLLQRVLRYIEQYDVVWVMNVTDVDDKMIERAKKDFPGDEPMEGLGKLADKYTDVFLDDIEKVGILRDDIRRLPRATDHIGEMQDMIRHLVKEGVAYISEGSVYFSIEKYQASGQSYGCLIDLEFTAKARVTDDQDQKEGVADFALWKAAKPGEPAWDFEVNDQQLPGRPGWHIECSVMSTHYLGNPFDIHTGGVDLKFPHHENELAQCQGTQANYYLHNEHLQIETKKMSKSLGNITKLSDIKDPLAFRYLVLNSHYRTQMDFGVDAVASAQERLTNLRKYTDQLVLARVGQLPKTDETGAVAQFINTISESLRDDLNSPKALAAFSFLDGKVYTEDAREAMKLADMIFGLKLVRQTTPLSADISRVVEEYEQARDKKDFARSDEIRKELEKYHKLGVSDTPQGTLLHFVK